MTGSRRRRTLAAAVAVVAVLVVMALPAGAGVGRGDPQPTPEPASGARSAEVTLRGVGQTPFVERDGTWNLVLDVDGAPAGATIGATIAPRFDDLGELRQAYFGVVDGRPLATIPALEVDRGTLGPDGARQVSLAVSLRHDAGSRPGWTFLSSGLRPGVYPVTVTVADAEGNTLTGTVVFLARVASEDDPGDVPPPVLVAPVLDLEAAPSVTARGEDETPLDTLARAGRLADGLAFTPDLPVTWVPRPETVEAIARQPEGDELLDRLARAGAERDVVDGTYVGLPLDAWVARDMTDELDRQRDRGHQVLTEHFGRVDSELWSATDGYSGAAADVLWDAGVRAVLLDPRQVADDPHTYGPLSVPTAQGRDMEALVVDHVVSDALVRRGDPVLGAADLAAELTLIGATGEEPTGVVVDPPETWPATLDDVVRLGQVLLDPAAPVRAVTVSQLLDDLPSRVRRSLVDRPPVDLGTYPVHLGSTRARLGSLTGATGATPEVRALDQRLLLSAAIELTAAERDRYVASVDTVVDRSFAAVEAPASETVTFTSSDGDLPLTLRNGLDDPINVLLRLESDSRVDLEAPTEQIVELQPGTNRIAVPVHTTLPGDSPVDVTVLTPDGAIVLDQAEYTIRSTAISGIGVFLSVGAALVLVLWWFRHWRQTRRLRHATAEGARLGARIAGTDEAVPGDG